MSRSLLLLTVVSFLSGCGLIPNQLDKGLNPYLGKHKDEYIKSVGPPTKCARLSTGGETCEWVRQGVTQSGVNCQRNYGTGGTDCSGGGGGSWEHRVVFTYDQAGVAQEWVYRGSSGKRSSKDSAAKASP
jgi:hypothetical protein